MNFTNVCHLNGKTYSMELNCTEEQLDAGFVAWHLGGALLQDAFPFLNAGEREFVKTGTPPHVWDEMFGDPDAINERAMEQASMEAQERSFSRDSERYYGAGD